MLNFLYLSCSSSVSGSDLKLKRIFVCCLKVYVKVYLKTVIVNVTFLHPWFFGQCSVCHNKNAAFWWIYPRLFPKNVLLKYYSYLLFLWLNSRPCHDGKLFFLDWSFKILQIRLSTKSQLHILFIKTVHLPLNSWHCFCLYSYVLVSGLLRHQLPSPANFLF